MNHIVHFQDWLYDILKSTSIVLCIDIPSGDEHEEDDLDDNDAELLGELGKRFN